MNQDPYTPYNGNSSDNQNSNYQQEPSFDPYAPPARKQSNAYAIASLVLGIVAIVCCCISELSLICSVLAIVFAVLSRRQTGFFDGMSTAGLVCGIVGAALAVFSIIESIVNPVVLDESFWQEYEKIMNDLMKEIEGAGAAALRFLK